MRLLAPAILALGLAGSASAAGGTGDGAALSTCLAAASVAKRGAETCIGAIQGPCLSRPDGGTTVGMADCTARETAAWDVRLNAAYRAALASDRGKVDAVRDGDRRLKGADILRDAQRAWIAFRDRKCDAARLPMEGGTGATLLAGDCVLAETARQAIWLETFTDP